MDEDQILQSIIADPSITDPSIDTSGLRTTTPTRTELLANVPEFSGLKFDPTQRSYIEDLYSVYGGGLPTISEPIVEDTAQIPGAVDTLVDVGGGGGQDQATGDSVAGFDPGVTPGPSGFIGLDPDMDIDPQDFAQEDYGIYDPTATTGGITGDPIEVGIPDNESGFVDPLGTIGGPPDIFDINVVGDPALNPGSTMVQGEDPYGTPEQQNLISQAFSKVGSTANDIMRDLSEIPGAIANFVDKTVDIAGQKINVGETLLKAGINKIVGGPISLVFDGIGALASNLPPGISETTNKAREVGLIQGDNTVTQDIYGINTQSMFGNYNQYNLDRVEQLEDKINKTPRDIKELEDRKNYIDSTGAAGDITPDATPTDIATGNVTGDATIAEIIAQQDRNEIQPTDPSLSIPDRGRGDDFDTTNEAAVNVGTPSFDGFDSGGFDPAPAPAAPAPSIPDRGRGQQYGGGGNGGGGSSGGGGESGYGGFCFDPNTPIQMANGSTKKIKNIQLGDDTKGGEVTGVFQFKATDEIHDYKGVTVAGSHYVKENNKFIMVQDSPISVKIDKIPVVYSLDTTGRRIFIKDIEFADYNGDGIAKSFLHNAGVDTKGFDKEVLRQVENRLI
jgi:hypothetical protein